MSKIMTMYCLSLNFVVILLSMKLAEVIAAIKT